MEIIFTPTKQTGTAQLDCETESLSFIFIIDFCSLGGEKTVNHTFAFDSQPLVGAVFILTSLNLLLESPAYRIILVYSLMNFVHQS